MAAHGFDFWGLHLVVTLVAAYAIVLALAFVVIGLRRVVGHAEQADAATTSGQRRLLPRSDGAARG
jgi:hypothetical protein